MELNFNLYPPDGYCFTERDGTRIRGESWRDLEARVRGYRSLNRFDIGNPLEDITVQICAKHGSFCRQPAPPVPAGGLGVPSFNQRVIEWFIRVIGLKRRGMLGRVDDVTANARAAICARCPAQLSLNHACEACLNSIKDGRKGLLDGAPSLHQNLLPCGALGEDCQTTVHVEQPPVTAAGQPANCWRRPK